MKNLKTLLFFHKQFVGIWLCLIFNLNAFSQSGPTIAGNHANETLITNQQWELVDALSDEFNGNTLSSKWDPRPVVSGKFNWVGRWPVLFEEENAKVAGGLLQLESEKFNNLKSDRNGSRNDWSHGGAIIRSVAMATPGMYMETQMRTNETFLGGGFWMVTPQANCNEIPKQELDITESLGFRTFVTKQPELNWYDNKANEFANGMNSTLRQRGTSCLPAVNRGEYFGPFDPSTGFHTYGAYWETANRVHFYLDGRYQGTVVPSIPFINGMVVNLSCEGYDFNYPTGNDVTDGFILPNGQPRPLWGRSLKYRWVRTWRVAPNNNPGNNSGQFYIFNRQTGKKLRANDQIDGSKLNLGASNWVGDQNKWERINTDNGYFYLRNVHSGMYFRPENDNNGSRLIQRPTTYSGGYTQWRMVTSNNGYFYLQNRATGKYFSPVNDVNFSEIQLRPTTARGNWTQWKFQAVGSAKSINDKIDDATTADIKLNFYPNPAINAVNIETKNNSCNLSILDMNGKVVITDVINNNTTKEIDLSNLNTGLYVIQYSLGNDVETKNQKLVILK